MKEGRSLEHLISALKAGEIRALSQSITLLESRLPTDRKSAQKLISEVANHGRIVQRIAVTGVPGVGKSTYIEKLGLHLVERGAKVAVLAIDPTSSRTGGSILGDKTRMEQLSAHSQAYIRPSASAETLGGVARKTRETMMLCEAAGFDYIIIETVGVGQSETAVRGMVDTFILLMLPGAGDELQGIKRGIMEMADLLLVNKVEEDTLAKARSAQSDYRTALHLLGADELGWSTQVSMISALTGKGLDESYDASDLHWNFLKERERLATLRGAQNLLWYEEMLRLAIAESYLEDEANRLRVAQQREQVRLGADPMLAIMKALES